jgi:anti-sigma regulatory factor (Ser/Thr protein kinase)
MYNINKMTLDARKSILFLAADPTDAARLRLSEELREIGEKLKLSQRRDEFILHQRLATRPADISLAMLEVSPEIVHFSGHTSSAGGLLVEDRSGRHLPIAPASLSAFFERFSGVVKCVLLNACYSFAQAQAIAQHVDYVIGMNAAISDRASIAFSIGFYQALGSGRSYEEAYKFGCVQIGLEGLQESTVPVLLRKPEAPETAPEIKIARIQEAFIQDLVRYNPHLLVEWEQALASGYWRAKIDCRDELLMADLASVVASALDSQGVAGSSIENAEIALTILARNVIQHAGSPIGEIEIAFNIKHKRLYISVSSLGDSFSITTVLSKFQHESTEMQKMHGLQRLMARGDVRILHQPGINTVCFTTRLSHKTAQGPDFLAVRLTPRLVVIGASEFTYPVWYYKLYSARQAKTDFRPTVNFEPIKHSLIQQWTQPLPVVIDIGYQPPGWTLNEIELHVLMSFRSLCASLARDESFKLLSPVPERWEAIPDS